MVYSIYVYMYYVLFNTYMLPDHGQIALMSCS